MRIPVQVAYLHSPHFHVSGITGKSLGERLDTRQDKSIELFYDRDAKELEITWAGRTCFIPESNVKSYFPFVDGEVIETKKVVPVGVIKAQVSTPQDHVFAGEGRGKSK